jgi:hypothetical protein
MGAVRITRDRLSPAQLRALQAQRRRLGLDEETYRRAIAQYRCCTRHPMPDVLWAEAGAPCTSSRHLSRAQAQSLITRWSIAGAPIGKPYTVTKADATSQAAAGITPLASPAQLALIGRLIPEVPWRSEDGYRLWMASKTSPLHGRPIHSFQDAEAIIEALKHMRDRTHAND